MTRLALVLVLLSLASPVLAQGPLVVVPWSAGAVDEAAMQRAAESVSLAIPRSAGSVMSVAETRSRFETTVSSDPPTVTSAELEQWTTYSRAAVRALADEDYTTAREALQHAQAISDRADAEMSREEARARQVLDTCLYGVRAYIEQHDAHAEEQMLGCRRLVPRIAPSPNIHTPEVVELFGRIDQRLAAAHRGPLSVASQPSGCTVRLNGIALGQTPFTSEQLAPGEYGVQVECGEGGHGRLHHVSVPDATGEVQLHIDARFDRVVQSDGVLRLAYADDADATAHRALDAVEIGRALEASEVWLVGVAADGSVSGERVRVIGERVIASAAPIASGSAAALVTALTSAPTSEVHESGGGGGDVGPAAWALMIGGGAAAIAGAVMIGVSAGDLGAVTMPHMGESLQASQDRANTATTIVGVGGALLGAGVIAAGIGIGLAVSDTSHHESTVSLHLGPTSVELTGTF